MQRYSIERLLPSVNVDMALLGDLERFILRKNETLSEAETADSLRESRYAIKIVDSFGVEELTSIDDFQLSYFPNDTKKIELSLDSYKPHLNLSVKFAIDRANSAITIRYKGKSARQTVEGLVAEILQIVHNSRTLNSWFHYGPGVDAAFSLISIWLIISSLVTYITMAFKPMPLTFEIATFLLVAGLSVIALLAAAKLRPYSRFHTRKNKSLDGWVNWLLLGFLSFILFTVVGVFFRKTLFGF